ncbi:hypothetical protein C6P46_004659 [Rhodotorula mucilaginosa]|uniref:ICE2-domain-containing protein n=1 Tax=Rhodotorula mucilaginosa TaxID=5537 RepID=A0A9P6VZH6_RHOMI|nr:hypothetical protein C6P46_004659 [Rhodotorula mucilaginosa]
MAGAVLRRRVTDWFHASIRFAAQLVSVLQVLLFLPLTLDIAGQDCMLALSLLLTLSFACSATLHLCVRTNTRWRPLSTLVAWLQPLVIPALLLLTLNLYSTSSTGEATLAVSDEDRHPAWLDHVRAAPSYWERLLRTSSPVFVILEGLCTLLCIQALSRFSLGRIQASRAPDLFRMGSLILAAGVYVASAYFLWESYGAVPDRISSTLIGVAVTTILFLSGISFSIQKGNVIESSLMLAYAVFQIFHLSSRPQMYTGGLLSHVFRATGTNGHPPLPPVVLQSLDAISKAVSQTFGAGVEFVMAAVAVFYAATRIVLNLKRQTTGSWNDDDRKLSDEEPAARIMTIGLAYARPLLIAVYTHLLVLSSSNDQVFWRWGNVFLVQLLWAIEIRLGQHLDDDETTAVAAAEEVEGGGGGGGGASASAGGATSSGGVGGGGGEGGGGGVATSSAVSGGGGGGGGSLSSSSKAAPAPVMVAAASTSGPSSVGGGSGVKWKGE